MLTQQATSKKEYTMTNEELLNRIVRIEKFLLEDHPDWINPHNNKDTILAESSAMNLIQATIEKNTFISVELQTSRDKEL